MLLPRTLLCQGESRQIPLRDASVQMIVTSPPYFRLRDYGTGRWVGGDAACAHRPNDTPGQRGVRSSTLDGGKKTTGHLQEGFAQRCPKCGAVRVDQQLGLEPLHDCLAWARGEASCGDCYICRLREVFAECYRVLRKDGIMMVNIADSYNAAGRIGHGTRQSVKQGTNRASATGADVCRATAPGLKPKDLCGIPQRLALALQVDGWHWRSDCIWSKTNPMPSSVKDRFTVSHEYVYMFTKSARYFFDAYAVREESQPWKVDTPTGWDTGEGGHGSFHRDGREKSIQTDEIRTGRNRRTVFTIPTEGFSGAHYATYPQALVEILIKAGTPEAGCCPQCRAPYIRLMERTSTPNPSLHGSRFDLRKTGTNGHGRTQPGERYLSESIGFVPGCRCESGVPVPSLVFDPFIGSGTTALVARALGRHCIGVELDAKSLDLQRERLGLADLAAWEGRAQPLKETPLDGLPLFCVDSMC